MDRPANGGFPEPLAGQPVRVARCHHDACHTDTRVRLPWAVSTEAVRLVVCDNCHQAYACEHAVDESLTAPGGVRGWLSDPDSPAWRYLSIPIAAAVVIAVLFGIQGC